MPTRQKAKATDADMPHHGVFTRDGETRTAYSRGAAVRMRFEGWEESQPAEPGAMEAVEAVTSTDD